MSPYYLQLLKHRLVFWLTRADAETDRKRQFAILDGDVRDLSKRIREFREKLRTGSLGFFGQGAVRASAVCALLIVGFVYYHKSHGIVRYGRADGSPGGDLVRVLRKYDAQRFKMRWVRMETAPGYSVEFTLNFCDPMDFGPGETLIFLAYRENGSCVEALEPHEEVGYLFERSADGHDTLAPNCHWGATDPECVPNLNEANFELQETVRP